MGWNEIIFGGLMIAGIAVFFFLRGTRQGKNNISEMIKSVGENFN
tara:strand:- start:233 stop:367 length:135 start_codon:yes stop_codon:yes gene_type:complete